MACSLCFLDVSFPRSATCIAPRPDRCLATDNALNTPKHVGTGGQPLVYHRETDLECLRFVSAWTKDDNGFRHLFFRQTGPLPKTSL